MPLFVVIEENDKNVIFKKSQLSPPDFTLYRQIRDKACAVEIDGRVCCPKETWGHFRDQWESFGPAYQVQEKLQEPSSERDEMEVNSLYQQEEEELAAQKKREIPWRYRQGSLEAAEDRVKIFQSLLELPIGHRLPSGKVVSAADRTGWAQRIFDTEKFIAEGRMWRAERGLKNIRGYRY